MVTAWRTFSPSCTAGAAAVALLLPGRQRRARRSRDRFGHRESRRLDDRDRSQAARAISKSRKANMPGAPRRCCSMSIAERGIFVSGDVIELARGTLRL